MGQRTFRCGNGRDIFTRPPAEAAHPREPDPQRFRTLLHFPPRKAPSNRFRVMAQLDGGGTALVCLGDTRQDAIRLAWAMKNELPAQSVRLRLEAWCGGLRDGTWNYLPC